ncbi:MAG: Crp/Fnr family transcriptional regulator [Candidatus Marinimicrobia bacterium]|nr:Crp/Fnr family transcriptional regulator [Candidatus Neomarinimicrobiota bacterium]
MKMIPCEGCHVRERTAFAELEPEMLDRIDGAKQTRKYKKGQVIFYEDNPAFGLYCIYSGKVKLYKSTAEGKRLTLQIADPGDQLGHLALFTGQPYSATGEALEDSTICFVDRRCLPTLMEKNPQATWSIINGLAQGLSITRDRATDIAYRSVRERVAGMLLQLKAKYGRPEGNAVRLDIALSREDLAELIGATKESLVRVLSDFRQEQLITDKGSNLMLLSPKKLAKIAGYLD